ncbi:hypothetical protein C0R09_18285 [Brevibacillus laterosporus]|uniref:hypothetical protein n=1 Tax=Brevibacillus laterosporus TaxID=1465 RepID=UPI000C78557A|nr:hypothetical protein [Brevibacillus laterosporus]AUM66307.1 hypothetical protein C0R09_18285 [Brevibacillus laterosporus]
MAKIQLANGQTVKAIRVWDGVKWTDRIGRVYTDKWLDFISYYEKHVYTGLGWNINYLLKLKQFSYEGVKENQYDFNYDNCNTLETDPNGNVYFGSWYGFVLFDKSFAVIRKGNYYAMDTAVSKNGDYVFMAEYGFDAEALFFMSKNGETKKIVQIPKEVAFRRKRGMCCDNEGNTYTHISLEELAKFDPAGNKVFSIQVPKASSDGSYGYGNIDIDNDGNIYRLRDEFLEKYDKTGKLIKNVKLSDKPNVRGSLYVDRDFVFVAIGNYSANPGSGNFEDQLVKLTKNLEVVLRINGFRIINGGSTPSYGDSVYCDREDGVYTVGRGQVRKNSKSDLSLIWEKEIEKAPLETGMCACTPGRYGAFGEV